MSSRNQKIVELLKRRQKDLTVFMDEVHKPHNLAAIVRTCDAVGIGDVHAVYPEGMVKACHGTSMGSNRWVTTHTHPDLESGIKVLKSQGMKVLAAHFSERAVDFRSIDYTQPTAILVGSEKYGVSEKAAELADEHILIPMLGMVQSLNVSVASALILYEAQRQRELANLYQSQQIDQEVFDRLRFEWLHPQVKAFCNKHQIRYPMLDENGDIQDEQWHQLRQSIVS
ncbi:tRNA (guanosine(18)-2'-O)-methyltransferase TrmH [Aliikangiella coralliicola]|uniref:tRNA (guanosine(18)-2'-O)-methyltransferase n=1 Tax=Aliikangiella coralliicola TaxID=2592383 RepID=A0A545UH43_9GAMM|nr:tRNA (guanosine(18)-2'-O)-methyltransferase TrmH [Aliikangiella coralliicola]TQV88791.1 tRNA (guanosine(18)-2'-O)-methyltransferase TrmH [Aliikangiella coralliicola]